MCNDIISYNRIYYFYNISCYVLLGERGRPRPHPRVDPTPVLRARAADLSSFLKPVLIQEMSRNATFVESKLLQFTMQLYFIRISPTCPQTTDLFVQNADPKIPKTAAHASSAGPMGGWGQLCCCCLLFVFCVALLLVAVIC